MLQETRDGTPLTYVYADQGSYEPLARIDGIAPAQVFYFHNAPNGEPESLTDNEGMVRWQGHCSAWGKLSYGENQQTLDYLRLQGQYLDRETGFHYNLFRYYDPDIGRFTQYDPIGLAGGINLYQYAQNPLTWIDPLGLTGEGVTMFYHAGDIKGPIDPSYGNGLNDFDSAGKGRFYVTIDRSQAERWARMRTDRNMSITQFDIPNSELAKLDIKVFDSVNGEWTDFVAHARKGTLSHSYDAVSGPILLNLKYFRRGSSPRTGSSQFAIYNERFAAMFNRFKTGCK